MSLSKWAGHGSKGVINMTVLSREELLAALMRFGPAQQQAAQPELLSGVMGVTTALSPQDKRTQTFQGMGDTIGQGWQQNLAQISALRAQNPAASPVPVGTPTMGKIGHEEGVRQYDVGHEEGVRQYDESMAFNREQFAADERYRAAQLALARMKEGSGYKLPAQDPVIYSNIQQRLQDRVEMYKQGVLSNFPDRQLQPNMKKNIEKRAVDMATRDFLQDAPALGATAKQQKETLDWLYRIYGIQDKDSAAMLTELDAEARIKAGAYGPDYDSEW